MNSFIKPLAEQRLDRQSALALAENSELESLMVRAAALRDQADDGLVTYSRKIFIPLTQLCRNVCHYCTFAQAPRTLEIGRASCRERV